MRWNHFAGSLAFAGGAAVVLPAIYLVLAPLLGGARAAAVLFVVAGFIHGLAWLPQGRGRTLVAAASLVALYLSLASPADPLRAVAVTSLLLPVMRAGGALRAMSVRRIVVESAISVASVAWVHAVLAPSLPALGIATWGFFLVQSAFPLCGDWIAKRSTPRGVDPFDRARSRLLAALDEGLH